MKCSIDADNSFVISIALKIYDSDFHIRKLNKNGTNFPHKSFSVKRNFWTLIVKHQNQHDSPLFSIELTLPASESRFFRNFSIEMTLCTMYGVVRGIQIVPKIHQNVLQPALVTLFATCFILICSFALSILYPTLAVSCTNFFKVFSLNSFLIFFCTR